MLIFFMLALIGNKNLVQRYRQSSPDDFWKEFSTSAEKQMTYMAIIGILREQRMVRDTEIVECAREEYGDVFSSKFVYRQGDRRRIAMQKPYAISRAYTALHPSLS